MTVANNNNDSNTLSPIQFSTHGEAGDVYVCVCVWEKEQEAREKVRRRETSKEKERELVVIELRFHCFVLTFA